MFPSYTYMLVFASVTETRILFKFILTKTSHDNHPSCVYKIKHFSCVSTVLQSVMKRWVFTGLDVTKITISTTEFILTQTLGHPLKARLNL